MQEFKSQKIKSVIKDLLKKKSITYEDLAQDMECSIPTIKRILGQEELSVNRLLQLCEILDIDLGELNALTNETDKNTEEAFNEEQQVFLAKNKTHFAYLMKLFEGKTPKQIAEEFGLTDRSTDKYLIALEKQDLIRVTGKNKVKPTFKGSPSFGSGVLAKVYFESFIRTGSDFFVDQIHAALAKANSPDRVKYSARYSMTAMKATRESYLAFAKAQDAAFSEFEKISTFEEKTKKPEELIHTVIIMAHTQVPEMTPALKKVANILGPIPNL